MKNDKVVLFEEKKDCCGCQVCMNVCSNGAITMKEDEFGYLYPQIEDSKCMSCGMCKKVCAYQNGSQTNYTEKSYAAVSKSENIIMKSASGGVCGQLANDFILNGGVVFGCAYKHINSELIPIHIKAVTIEELQRIQGSKYVQSNTGFVYKEVKKCLIEGKQVLFSGTPCQAAALRRFLGNKSYDNLFIIDIICHGVPNSRMFNDYLKLLSKKSGKEVVDFSFREKGSGWGLCGSASYLDKNNCFTKKIIPAGLSSYYTLFLTSVIYRENCYSCPYADANRIGDITIGDYWGIEKQHSEYLTDNGGDMRYSDGISCILVNTENGEKLINNYASGLNLKPSTFDKIKQQNEQLVRPSKMNPFRDKVLKLYKEEGYVAVDNRYNKNLGIKKYFYLAYSKMPKSFMQFIRKIK